MTRFTVQPATAPGSAIGDLGVVDALVQSSFLIQAVLAELAAESELSVTQVRLLGVLRDREPRMAQLAQLLGLTKQSATGLIDRAERRGLLTRVSIPVGDERAVHVSLTPAGHRLADHLAGQVARRVSTITAALSDTKRARLSSLLSEVVLYDSELHDTDLSPHHPRTTP